MQQFTVPQFIDVEDKVIGPITARQFVIMLGGFLIIGVSYKIFDFSLFITFSAFIFIFSIIFSFIKINGRPFHFFVLNFIQTLKRPSLRVWHNSGQEINIDYGWGEKPVKVEPAELRQQEYSVSRLAELSLIVDTKGVYRGEERAGSANIKSGAGDHIV